MRFLFILFFFTSSSINAKDSLYVRELDKSFLLHDTVSLYDYYEQLNKLKIKESKKREYCQIGLEASKRLEDNKGIYRFCRCQISNSGELSDTIYLRLAFKALKDLSIKHPGAININKSIGNLYLQWGDLYFAHGLYYLSIQSYHKSIQYQKKESLCYDKALTNIGVTYYFLENYEKSLNYYEQAASMLTEQLDKTYYHRSIYGLYYHFAVCYNKLNKKELALKYAIESDKHFEIISYIYREDQAIADNSEFSFPKPLKKEDKFNYYKNLFLLGEELNGLPWNQEELLRKVTSYNDDSKTTQLDYSYILLSVAISNSEVENARRIFENAAGKLTDEKPEICVKYYELTEDYNKALVFQKKVIEQEKIRLSNLRQEQVIFANGEYKSKEKEIDILRLQQKIGQQSRRTLLLQVGLGFLSLFLLFLFLLFRQRNNKKQLIIQDIKNKEFIIHQSQELANTEAMRQRLFTNIAHELRTPLTFVNSALNHLKKTTPLTNSSQISLDRALRQSKEIEQMVEQIMSLSKNKVKDLEVELQQFKLVDLFNYLHDWFAPSMKQKDIQFTLNASATTPSIFISDVEKLLIILKNLLSNALKFTLPGDKISLDSCIYENRLQITIEDTGRGIAPSDLEHVFERFYQAKEGELQAEGGFGIGLAICQEYMNLLKGTIYAKSDIGKGSQFTIELPISKNTKKNPAFYFFPPLLTKSKLFSNNKHLIDETFILVVDDNLEMCSYLKDLLSNDYTIITAHNGREALKIISRSSPILVITDLMMPVMAGMKLVQKIKENIKWVQIPILILTAKDNVLDELKASRIGVDDYLMKPFDEDELKANIYRLLELAEERLLSISDEDVDKENAVSPIQTSVDKTIEKSDQRWLEDIETTLYPLINDYNLNVEKIAEILSLSPAHITRKMKRIVGLTPKKYITELRLLSGRKMLENRTEDSVKAVAYSVGFKSDKTFSRNFKARFGKYPSEYLN